MTFSEKLEELCDEGVSVLGYDHIIEMMRYRIGVLEELFNDEIVQADYVANFAPYND